jgi:hypothetical protein
MAKRRRWVHLATIARVDKPHESMALVRIDRERGLVRMKRHRAWKSYTIPLGKLVELGMARLMREEAEHRGGNMIKATWDLSLLVPYTAGRWGLRHVLLPARLTKADQLDLAILTAVHYLAKPIPDFEEARRVLMRAAVGEPEPVEET